MKKLFTLCLLLCATLMVHAAEIIHGPYIQAVTDDSAYIVWVTDKASYGWVEVKAEGEKKAVTYIESYIGLKHYRRVHRVPVKNLTAGTLYEYKIFSQDMDKSGNLQSKVSLAENPRGEKLSFRTLDPNKKEFSFMMVTDIHYNNYFEGLFESIVTPERLADKDFVIFNGDMVTTMSSEKNHFERLFTKINNIFATNKPFYFVRGNHEARGNYAKAFMDLYPTWTGMPYYMFRQGPVCFVVVDGGEDKPDSDIEYYGTAAFDLYRENEGEWLQQVFDSEEFKTAKYRVLLSHIPLNNKGWHGGRHAWQHICQRCENQGFNLMISGHTHRYSYRDIGADNQTFPTLVFGPKQYLDIKATEKSLTIDVKDVEGNVFKSFSYDPIK